MGLTAQLRKTKKEAHLVLSEQFETNEPKQRKGVSVYYIYMYLVKETKQNYLVITQTKTCCTQKEQNKMQSLNKAKHAQNTLSYKANAGHSLQNIL